MNAKVHLFRQVLQVGVADAPRPGRAPPHGRAVFRKLVASAGLTAAATAEVVVVLPLLVSNRRRVVEKLRQPRRGLELR
jgi:hypothetical protein